jgi:hypothetical protein
MSRYGSLRCASLALASTALLLVCAASSQAASLFGAYTRGSDLVPDSSAVDGGSGSSSASILESTFQAQAGLGGATYTPVLKAKSVSVNAVVDDDYTSSVAEAYQSFTSSISQTITLDLVLHGVVTNDGTPLSSSYVLADVAVVGGSGYSVSDSYCSGKYAFGVYLCGSTLGSSNLYIPNGDVTLLDSISFDVSAGEQFGVYGILRANSRDGTSNAFDTLEMSFEDDTFITAAVPEPSTALLCGGGLLVLGLRGRLRRR